MSAVRGYDIPDGEETRDLQNVKVMITGRIRAILFPRLGLISGAGIWTGARMKEDEFVMVEESVNQLREKREHSDLEHWFSHLRRAIEASRGHRIWNGFVDRLITLFVD